MIKKIFFICFFSFLSVQAANSQVLISLLLGDKLNSGKIKFGLEGGYNLSNVTNLETAKPASNFNLGFYFDFLLKEEMNWYVHSGVIVKSTMGANLDPYSLNDEALDSLFAGADVRRKLNMFNVPILARYKFKNNLFVELGPMLGIVLKKSNDKFSSTILEDSKDNLGYDKRISGDYHRIDFGAEIGLGYQLKAMHGMCLAVKYYHGLMDSKKNNTSDPQFNTSFYVVASIPIGAGEKAKAKNAAAKAEKAAKNAEKEKKALENSNKKDN